MAGTVPASKNLVAGTVPASKNLVAGTVPASKNLVAGTSLNRNLKEIGFQTPFWPLLYVLLVAGLTHTISFLDANTSQGLAM